MTKQQRLTLQQILDEIFMDRSARTMGKITMKMMTVILKNTRQK